MLHIGQKVHCKLYGGKDGVIYNIQGDQHPETVESMASGVLMRGGNAYIDIVYENGTKTRVPESILHGVQWELSNVVVLGAEVERLLLLADIAEIERRNAADEEKRKRTEATAQLLEDHPELTVLGSTDKGRWAVGAANIRKELARVFPGFKFSVTSERYSGGCSININWTDGPTTEEVTKITGKYEEGHFNGMDDIYEFNNGVWPEVFGGAKYVFESRNYSQEVEDTVIRDLGLCDQASRDQRGGISFPDHDDYIWFRRELANRSFLEKGGK